MGKRGRKKLPRLDIAGKEKVFREVNTLLRSNFGKKKKYVCIVSYETEPENGKPAAFAQILTNLDDSSSLVTWKLILNLLITHTQNFVNLYDLNAGIASTETFNIPKPEDKK